VLKDKEGRERIVLFMDTSYVEPFPTIKISDDSSRDVIRLGGNRTASFLQFVGQNNIPLNCYHINESGAVGIDFNGSDSSKNADQTLAIGITLPDSHPYGNFLSPQLKRFIVPLYPNKGAFDVGMFISNKKEVRFWNGYTSDDENGLYLMDSKNNTRLVYGCHSGISTFYMKDDEGKNRVSFRTGDFGASFLLWDKKGNLRTVLGTTDTKDRYGRNITHPESSIFLFNENGNSVFSAP